LFLIIVLTSGEVQRQLEDWAKVFRFSEWLDGAPGFAGEISEH
jgi:hypothetical protein